MKKTVLVFLIFIILLSGCSLKTFSGEAKTKENTKNTENFAYTSEKTEISVSFENTSDSTEIKESKSNSSFELNETTETTETTTIESFSDTTEKPKVTDITEDFSDAIEIKEKMFATQITEININSEDYINKKIKLQGFFYSYQISENEIGYAVLRRTNGCCGTDGLTGFSIVGDFTILNEDDWVETIGVLEKRKSEWGEDYLVLNVLSITVLPERGVDFVTQ